MTFKDLIEYAHIVQAPNFVDFLSQLGSEGTILAKGGGKPGSICP